MEEEKNSSKEKLSIVKSRNSEKGRGNNKKIVLTVDVKDIPEDIKKEDLVAAFKVNAQEEKSKDKKGKFKAKYLVPVLVPLVLIGAIKGCTHKDKDFIDVPTEQTIVQQINGEYYDIDSPYVFMEGVTNAAGQEGMTANELEDGNVMEGKHYDADKQFDAEEKSSVGQEDFSRMEEELDECMKVLTSSETNQTEKSEAARKALSINQKIEKIYTDNLEFIEKQGESFSESSNAFKDSHTEEEIAVIKATIDEYKQNLGLTTANIGTLGQIVQLTDDGFAIDVKGTINQRGDYSISGEAVKKVAEEVGYDKEAEKKYDDFMKQNYQEKDEKNIGGDYNAR